MIKSLISDTRTAMVQSMIDAFEKANSNIDVELISPPFDQADNKIRMMLSAKDDIDVVEARDLNVAEFVNNGYLEPLKKYTNHWSEFYRADWLKDAGIAVPKIYQELVDAAIKLTDKSKNRSGFSFRGGPGANSVPDTMVLAYKGADVNTSG